MLKHSHQASRGEDAARGCNRRATLRGLKPSTETFGPSQGAWLPLKNLHLWKQGTVNNCRCSVMSNSLRPRELYSPWNFPGHNTGVGSRALLQGIFLIQGLSPGLPHCRRILYQWSHQGSPSPTGPPICKGSPGKMRLYHFSPHSPR